MGGSEGEVGGRRFLRSWDRSLEIHKDSKMGIVFFGQGLRFVCRGESVWRRRRGQAIVKKKSGGYQL